MNTARIVAFCTIILLLLSVIAYIPFIDEEGFAGTARGDYVGFSSDFQANDDTTDKEQSGVAMAVYNNDIYLVWHDMRNGDFDIYFTKSTDGGKTWGDGVLNDNDIRVDDTDSNLNNTDNDTTQKYPDIAVDGSGNIYVVWQDDREGRGDNDIYIAKSTDGGAAFGTNTRVDHNGTGDFDQEHPSIAVDASGDIFIAWQDERNLKTDADIYFTSSSDGGSSFASPDVNVDDDTGTGRLQRLPKLIVQETGGTPVLHMVWQDERSGTGNYDIRFSKSIDGGSTWGDGADNNNDKIINDVTSNAQEHPDIALCGNGDLVAVWDDERVGNFKNIYMSRSTNGGSSWDANIKLSDSATNDTDQANPVIATNSSDLAISWIDDRNSPTQTDIYFTLSRDNGLNFGPLLQADSGTSNSIQTQPDIVIAGRNEIYLTWEDNRNISRGLDIYFATSQWIVLKAPTLSSISMTPAQGQADTEFLFTAVYTDSDNDAPDAGYPKLYFFKDTDGTDPYTGSPFVMGRQMMPAQDSLYTNGMIYEKRLTLNEDHNYTYYITTKALTGNTSLISTNLTKGPVLDKLGVIISDEYPQDLMWYDNVKINCSISIRDQGFAGVDPISVMYRTTTNGTNNFGEWTNSGMKYYITPEWVNVSSNIFFDDGIDNYIQWRAMDKYGNGPTETDYNRINIDTTSVIFSEPIPDPSMNYWYNSEKLEVGITISDGFGAGVNGSSIEYSISVTGVEGYGEWQSANITTVSEKFVVRHFVIFSNGTDNYLRYRASDALGNGPNNSANYRFRIDTTLSKPKVNNPPSPPSNVKPASTMDRTPYIRWDEGTDDDDDKLNYFIKIGTSVNGSEFVPWTSLGGKLGYQVSKNMALGTYYIHLQSSDGHDYSDVLITTMTISTDGNTPPEPPDELLPLYTSEKRPMFTWSKATDADSDTPLTYYIQIGRSAGGEDILVLTWVGYSTYYEFKGLPLDYGTYHVRIIVYDSMDWSEPGDFVVKVANYDLEITGESTVSVPQGESRTITINTTNKGSHSDNVTLNYSEALSGHANLTFTQTNFKLDINSMTSTTLKITGLPTGELGTYYLKLTAVSEDGKFVASHTVIVTITETTIGGKPDDGKNGDGDVDDDDFDSGSTFTGWMQGMFFWLVLLMLIFVVAIFAFMATRGRRKDDKDERTDAESRKREEYDNIYSEGERPPPPHPAAGMGYDDYYGSEPQQQAYDEYGGGGYPTQPPQGQVQYYDDYGTQQVQEPLAPAPDYPANEQEPSLQEQVPLETDQSELELEETPEIPADPATEIYLPEPESEMEISEVDTTDDKANRDRKGTTDGDE